MTIDFEWFKLAKDLGGIGIAIAVIYFGYQAFRLVMTQWANSTDSLNKNTDAFNSLSDVFAKQAEREIEFQKEIMETLRKGVDTAKDTNDKVSEIHKKIIA
jgi:hypothetical protein